MTKTEALKILNQMQYEAQEKAGAARYAANGWTGASQAELLGDAESYDAESEALILAIEVLSKS